MKVLITERAEGEIQTAHDWWSAHRSALQAGRWYRGIYRAIDSLRTNASRNPLIPEHEHFSAELRQLTFGLGRRPTHRVVFSIQPDAVVVLAVRHLAQQNLSVEDLS